MKIKIRKIQPAALGTNKSTAYAHSRMKIDDPVPNSTRLDKKQKLKIAASTQHDKVKPKGFFVKNAKNTVVILC